MEGTLEEGGVPFETLVSEALEFNDESGDEVPVAPRGVIDRSKA